MNTNSKINSATHPHRKHSPKIAGASFGLLAALLFGGLVWAQPPPLLTITPLGTNQFSIWFTNNIGTQTYDILSTPVLADPDYPWQWAAVGSPGQTNFLVTGIYETGFYQAILDTNAIPLWEAANPTNASLGILNVLIDSPTNTAVLQ